MRPRDQNGKSNVLCIFALSMLHAYNYSQYFDIVWDKSFKVWSRYRKGESSMISPHFNLWSHWSSNNPPPNGSLPLNHWVTNGNIIIECGVTVVPRLLGPLTLFFRSQHFLLSELGVISTWGITSHLSSKLKGCTGLWVSLHKGADIKTNGKRGMRSP